MTTTRTPTRRRRPPPPAPPTSGGPRWVLAAVAAIAFLVVLAVGIALAADGEDGDAGDGAVASFGPVAVDGVPLPAYAEPDPAIGSVGPNVLGRTPDGDPIEIGLAGQQPTLVVFLAHWCPHCQAELPLLVDLAEEGAFDGMRVVAVLTGTNPDAPNHPPVAWLEREGWTGEVLLDDERFSAMSAYGQAGYPYLVALDTSGRVTGRTTGEQPAEVVMALADGAR
jgi:thiol-disulfide isomerase/thioredoxin